MQIGMVINSLSTPADTLFLDGFDDIIYWVSQKESSYRYSWYTSLMFSYKIYINARIDMFHKNPPDFYYGSCWKVIEPQKTLPDFVKKDYVRLNNETKPSCLWVKKSKLPTITSAQWNRTKFHFYSLPKTDG